MIKYKIAAAIAATMIFSGFNPCMEVFAGQGDGSKDFRKALTLYENNMFGEAKALFEDLSRATKDYQAEGFAVLCAVNLGENDYIYRMNSYIKRFPYSGLVPAIRYRHALNLFDNQKYIEAVKEFELSGEKNIGRKDRLEYYYKLAYSRLQIGDNDGAMYGFKKIDAMPFNNYSSPSRFALGLLEYESEKFKQALEWFGKSMKDKRFEEISNYYIMECRFMMKDYAYVIKHGEDIFNNVPEDRKPRLARILSESYLVEGDVASAKRYYDEADTWKKNRDDYFYAGSLLYAVKDYKGAIDNYSEMTDRSDSLGQIANYQMAFSYIQTKNKVAAMDAFREASLCNFNEEIQEDAFFNYAKLSFDLNNDPSVFDRYMSKYSDKKRGNMIYAYQALSALHSKDYAAAVEVYDKIDELDYDMRSNYMKANYLRAEQLIRSGSYRAAEPCLKAVSYYAAKRSPLNMLSKYWLAETYYRDEKYSQARSIFNELYNLSALDNRPEGSLIPYNIAYCYFKENDFDMASSWFDKYLSQGKSVVNYRDAILRKADASFMKADYNNAVALYSQLIDNEAYPDDVYPIYRAGLAYGLSGDAKKKIEVLSGIMDSPFRDRYYYEALYELGRTYLDAKQDDNAIVAYNKLLSESKDSVYIAKAVLGLGLANRNKGSYDKALEYYKKVVEDMPSTDYANDALVAIESIYQEKQEPEQYMAYVDSMGKIPEEGENDMEDVLFNGAEKVYLAGNYTKALVSLGAYEDKYPEGRHIEDVYFYIAESYRGLDNKDKACDYYKKVMNSASSSFAEVSALNYSKMCYDMERFQDSFDGYDVLQKIAIIDANKKIAALGLMRAAFKAKGFKNAILYSNNIIAGKDFSSEQKREAKYIAAKSYLASSQRDKAFEILGELSAFKSTKEGAEAAYMLIQDSYDRGDFKDVENRVFAFSDAKSSQTYWLAKSFILLGDSYVEQDEIKQARATFESIRDGYKPLEDSDDVLEEVNFRLAKLNEMENQALLNY